MNKIEFLDIIGTPYSDIRVYDYQFYSYLPYISGDINYNDEI